MIPTSETFQRWSVRRRSVLRSARVGGWTSAALTSEAHLPVLNGLIKREWKAEERKLINVNSLGRGAQRSRAPPSPSSGSLQEVQV